MELISSTEVDPLSLGLSVNPLQTLSIQVPDYRQLKIKLLKIDDPLVSVIFVARNEDEWLAKSLDSLYSTKNKTAYEVIVYDDLSEVSCSDIQVHQFLRASTQPVGPARARNHGAMNARAPILIFCDAHLKFHDYWIDLLVQPLLDNQCDAVNPIISDIAVPSTKGYGWRFDYPTFEYKWQNPVTEFALVAGVAGGCFAIKKEVFFAVGMFDKAFLKWGLEDSELDLRMGLAGYRCGILPSVDIGHFFKEKNEYGIDWHSYTYNALRMFYVNTDTETLEQALALIKGGEKEKRQVLEQVKSTSKYRKRFCASIRKLTFAQYIEQVR